MSNEHIDPSGSTDQFKAFVQADTVRPAVRGRLPLIVGVAVAALVVVVVVAVLAVA